MIDIMDRESWAKMSHAYGDASDLPNLFSHLSLGGNAESDAYREIFDRVVHQLDSFDSSRALFPHLIRLALNETIHDRHGFFIVVAGIDISRQIHSAVPDTDYLKSLWFLPELIAKYFACDLDGPTLRSISACLFSFKGEPQMGKFLLDFDTSLLEN